MELSYVIPMHTYLMMAGLPAAIQQPLLGRSAFEAGPGEIRVCAENLKQLLSARVRASDVVQLKDFVGGHNLCSNHCKQCNCVEIPVQRLLRSTLSS